MADTVKHTPGSFITAFERDYPELYWHIAKGKVSAGEPLYGAIICLTGGQEIGHGESNLSAEDAFKTAFTNSGLLAPATYSGPSRAEVRDALETLRNANGADLDSWSKGALPSGDITEAIKAFSSQPMSSKINFTSDDDALEFLKTYGHEETGNGIIRGDWRAFDASCREAVQYLCDEWDFIFEQVPAIDKSEGRS